MDAGPDLRSVLKTFAEKGELSEVTGRVDWDIELGVVAREVLRRKGPALVFRNIEGYPEGEARCTKVTTGLLASFRRLALVLGFDEAVSNERLVQHVMEKNLERIKPAVVEDGPVHEHVLTGADINLFDFPVPRWHHLDGGRYINTFGAVVTHGRGQDQMNVGVYRGMIGTKNTLPVLLVPGQHWGRHFATYREASEPMPVACVYGWHPVMDFIAGSPLPADVCEWDVMGAYLGQPVPLVRCKTVDLMVPASAEMVVEGFIDPDPATFALEGPFGEFTGYVSDVPTKRPVIQVTAITHRENPIFRGTLEGSLPGASGENSYMSSLQRAGIAWNLLRQAAVPGILNVVVHPVTNGTTVVVQIEKAYEGQAQQVASALWSSGAALFRYKTVIVVDDDIDPTSYDAIDWAIAYRVRPGTDDMVVWPGSFGSPLDPSTPLEERSVPQLGTGLWNRLLIDATKTWRYPRRKEWLDQKFPPTVAHRPEDVQRVRERFSQYGFTGWDPEGAPGKS